LADLFGTIDIGSTNCKIGIFDEEANFLYRDDSPISSQLLRRSGTIDPFEIWETVSGLLGRLPERIKRRLRALCVIGQGPTVVPVDRSGQPLYRAITWLDGRGKERIPVLIDQGVDPQLAAGLSALEWLKEELSERAVLLQPADYVAYRLTGRLANMSFPFVGYLPWSRQALEEREWSHAFLVPEIVEPGSLFSNLTQEAADRFNLSPQTLLVAGAPDFVAALVGTGTIEDGSLCDRGGSSQGVTLCSKSEVFPPGLMTTPFFKPGLWKISAIMNTTGIALEWFCRKVTGQPLELTLEQAVGCATPTKILFLPYLSGERSPHWDSKAKGVFWGLTLDSDARRMTVAILESVGYAIADAIERMENAGCVIKRIRTTGKQALSPIWTQIKSDILGRPVEVPEIRESELWGGALFSMKAVSNRDLTFLSHEKTRVGQTYYPDSKKHLLYKELLSMFQSLYPANKPLFAQWARIDFARGPTTQRD